MEICEQLIFQSYSKKTFGLLFCGQGVEPVINFTTFEKGQRYAMFFVVYLFAVFVCDQDNLKSRGRFDEIC